MVGGQLSLAGTLVLDAGAVEVLQHSGRSLLAVGIQSVSGSFLRGDVVACHDHQGVEIARGLVNYDAVEVARLCGKNSDQIESLLGYVGEEEIIHRDNLILLTEKKPAYAGFFLNGAYCMPFTAAFSRLLCRAALFL